MKQAAGAEDFEFKEMTQVQRDEYASERRERARKAPKGSMPNRIRKRVQELSTLIYKRDKHLPVVHRNSGPWLEWQDWRQRHGISNSYFNSAECYTVPTELPPIDIDRAIREFGSGSLKDKLQS